MYEHDRSTMHAWLIFAVGFLVVGPCFALAIAYQAQGFGASWATTVALVVWLVIAVIPALLIRRYFRRRYREQITTHQSGIYRSWE